MAAATTTPAVASSSPVNVKLLLIGNASVGKSSLLLRFSDEQRILDDEGTATIGVDFKDNKVFERSRRGTHGIMLVYLVASRETFDALPKWFAEIDTYGCPIDSAEDYILNKEHSRQVPTSEGQTVVTRKECLFLESSAKASVGMREVFQDLVKGTLETPELWAPVTPESGRRKRGGGWGGWDAGDDRFEWADGARGQWGRFV
ncbi:ras-domain-containing protein [Pisolithus croceorrhizus]|nr:ras-domain-containing protein [Pisolithus croceorrhizus]